MHLIIHAYVHVHPLTFTIAHIKNSGLPNNMFRMALRTPFTVLHKPTPSKTISAAVTFAALDCHRVTHSRISRRAMATVIPPVMQDSTSARGPTAMVFMNMGGPATTDQVGPFLSRLFVILS
jgi:ferrochelatase